MSVAVLTVFCLGGIVFLCCFFMGLCRESRDSTQTQHRHRD
jgi:hypothetical protein